MASAPNGASIQGVVDAGQAVAGFPVSMGFKDPTGNNQFVTGDALGNLNVAIAAGGSSQVEGKQAAGAAITENPVLIAGQFSGNVKLFGLDASGGVTQGQPNAGGTASWLMQGAASSGAAVAGNPVLIGSVDSTGATVTSIKSPPSNGLSMAMTGVVAAAACLWSASGQSTQWLAQGGTGVSDADLGKSTGIVSPNVFNGTTYDRVRNNTDVTFLASAARTTTQGPTNITTFNARAIYIVLDMTNVAAGPSVTLKVDMIDPASGKAVNLLTGAPVIAATTNIYKIGVGLTPAANLVANEYLPRTIAVTVTANNANSGTYSVGYSLIAA